jgi:mRNA interferase RelE/StbE
VSYGYALSPRAERYFARLDRPTQRRIADRLDELAVDPFDPAISKRLQNRAGLRSARVGGLRILYQVHETDELVRIEDIGPRGQVYRER